MRDRIRLLYEQYGPPTVANFTCDDLKGDLPAKALVVSLADQNGQIVLIKRKPQHDYPGLERYWWLPGGGLELSERIDKGAIREFKEETGLEIQLTKLLIARFKENKRLSFFFRGHVIGGSLSPDQDPCNTTRRCPVLLAVRDIHPGFTERSG